MSPYGDRASPFGYSYAAGRDVKSADEGQRVHLREPRDLALSVGRSREGSRRRRSQDKVSEAASCRL